MRSYTSDRLPRWLIAASILLGIVLRLANMSSLRDRTPDERVYTAQAQTILHEGLPGVRSMAAEYARDPAARLYPTPSRLGYTSLVAGIMAASGRSDAQAGSWASTTASVATLPLVALIGVRFLTPWAGAAATFMLAVFPPDLVVARRAWSDALVSFLTSTMLFCALSLARGGPPRWLLGVFLAAGSAFVLTKETALVVWGLCVGWLVGRQRVAAVPAVLAAAATGALSLAFVFWAVGGMSVFLEMQSGLAASHAANAYALDYQNGPPYWLLKTFWIASPVTTSLALLGLVAAPFSGRWRDRPSVAALAAFALVFLLLPFGAQYWLNLRYASPAFAPLCLLAAAALCLAFELAARQLAPSRRVAVAAACCAGLVVAGAADYRYFKRWFVATETADLAVRMVFETRGYSVAGASSARSQSADLPDAATAYLNQSLVLFQERRFEEAIASARQAIRLEPDYAEAYNNVAAAYAELAMWDEAILAAEEAIRLKPDFALARNNLAWALAQKAKADAAGSAEK